VSVALRQNVWLRLLAWGFASLHVLHHHYLPQNKTFIVSFLFQRFLIIILHLIVIMCLLSVLKLIIDYIGLFLHVFTVMVVSLVCIILVHHYDLIIFLIAIVVSVEIFLNCWLGAVSLMLSGLLRVYLLLLHLFSFGEIN
jgi:hypothetical protein